MCIDMKLEGALSAEKKGSEGVGGDGIGEKDKYSVLSHVENEQKWQHGIHYLYITKHHEINEVQHVIKGLQHFIFWNIYVFESICNTQPTK